ncbi:MbnP family protein [Haliscomenobacter sp.]|uniref:MbnP family protein n=1 Tax=Haliscomenobacter sp. TaxID=2717303 RepID=UPI003BA8658C
MKKVLKLVQLGILFGLIIFFAACATREEGCNDALANNFDLAADKPCDGCCEYPGVRIRLTHKYGSAAMVYNQAIFADGSGNPFGFGDLRFYLSNIQVVSIGNKVIDVQEPLDVYLEKTAGDTLKTSIPNSFGLARGLGQADMYIQSYRDTATINRIRFTVGVSGEMNQANPLRLPSDHPMRSSVYDGMYLGAQNGYVFTRALYYAKDTVDVKISGSANLRTIEVSFSPIKLQRGYNLNVLMDVNYARWFQNVNVNSDTPAQISQKITQNLAQSFTVTAVSTGL